MSNPNNHQNNKPKHVSYSALLTKKETPDGPKKRIIVSGLFNATISVREVSTTPEPNSPIDVFPFCAPQLVRNISGASRDKNYELVVIADPKQCGPSHPKEVVVPIKWITCGQSS